MHDEPLGVSAIDLSHRAAFITSKLYGWIAATRGQLNVESGSKSRIEGFTVLIPARIWILANALKPLVTDEVGDHPVIVDKVGVKVRAVRAVVAILSLMISGTNCRPDILVRNDLAVRDILALERAVTQKGIPRVGAV